MYEGIGVLMNNIDLMNFWIESSNNDFDTMNVLFTGGKYTWSLFVGHLVIEKLLKGYYAKINKGAPHALKSHDLVYLASKMELDLTDEQEELLNTITRFNIDGRYDDYKNQFYNLCTKEYTSSSIVKINKVRNWLLDLLNDNVSKESEVGNNDK